MTKLKHIQEVIDLVNEIIKDTQDNFPHKMSSAHRDRMIRKAKIAAYGSIVDIMEDN